MSNDPFAPAWKKQVSTETEGVNPQPEPEIRSEQPVKPAQKFISWEESSAPMTNKPQSKQKTNWWRKLSPKKRKIILGLSVFLLVILGILAVGGLIGYGAYVQAQEVKAELQQAATEGKAAYASFKTQNLPETKVHLQNAKQRIESGQSALSAMKWTKGLPVVGKYYTDGEAGLKAGVSGVEAGILVIEAIEPHADVLGFTGEGTFTGGTTEDRIGLMLETLQQITPQLDAITVKVEEMNGYIAEIDENDYPEELSGYPVKSYIKQLHGAGETAKVALTDARPVIEQLPAIAGADGRKKYLVIFQNDNELRPTGGFMTAYAVVFIENGKVTPEKSDDIYELDKKFKKKPAIPEILGKYLTTESKWNLRDMNIDPNFASSMENFYEYYQQVPGEPNNIDGIIAVDTNLLSKIVEILGPIEIPGYGTFSSEIDPKCDCPQIILALSEIIDRPTPYHRVDRKGILAPMMQSIIQKTYATSRDKWPLLADLLWKSIEGRHAQFYFLDQDMQNAALSINAAGIIPQVQPDQDYLTIIDANLGGAKSNLFVDISGVQTVESIADGKVTKQVEMTYRNTHAASNCNLEAGLLCLNANLNNWTRWYVPKGVEVKDLVGFENGYTIDDSHEGYDVIEGFFKLAPMGQAKVRATYTVPFTGTEYALRMQKQAGTDPISFELITPDGQTEFVLDKDITVKLP